MSNGCHLRVPLMTRRMPSMRPPKITHSYRVSPVLVGTGLRSLGHEVPREERLDITRRNEHVNTGRFKKSFKTLKAYINLFRGHV
jgi:hypothetical protein